jgi:hypothetical protein
MILSARRFDTIQGRIVFSLTEDLYDFDYI